MDVLLKINFDSLKFNVFLFPPSKAQLTGDFAPYAKRSEMFVALIPFGIILFSCNTEGVGDGEGHRVHIFLEMKQG